MAIGALLGHMMTMMHHCCKMMAMNHPYGQMMAMRHPCCPMMMEPRNGGYGREREYRFEHKFREGKEVGGEQKGWFEQKSDREKHQPGCKCPRCSKKAGCPMMDKK